MYREGIYTGHRHDSIALPTFSSVQTAGSFGPVPPGYCWYLENLAYCVVGLSHTAILDVGVVPDSPSLPIAGSWDHAGMVDRVASATLAPQAAAAHNYANPIYLPENHFLYVVAFASGGTLASGDNVTVAAQFSTHQLNPAQMMSPEDRFQAAKSHEHRGAPEALAATGARAV